MKTDIATVSKSSRYYAQDRAKQQEKLESNKIHRLRYISVASGIIAAVALATTVITFSKQGLIVLNHQREISQLEATLSGLNKGIEDRDKVIAEKESEIELYQQDIVTVVNEYNTLYNDFMALTDMNVALAKDNAELSNQENNENAELNDLRHRAELYEKYDYAIINSMDENLPEEDRRTDITYDQIDTLEALAAENGLSEDAVSLVLAIAMNESRGQEKAKNPYSTATGYCGILNTTGKYLYEDIMGNPRGSYSHDMCYNGYINLELSLQYIKYLNDMYGGDVMRVVNGYRGYCDAAYDSALDANLQKAGKSLYTLQLGGD